RRRRRRHHRGPRGDPGLKISDRFREGGFCRPLLPCKSIAKVTCAVSDGMALNFSAWAGDGPHARNFTCRSLLHVIVVRPRRMEFPACTCRFVQKYVVHWAKTLRTAGRRLNPSAVRRKESPL